MKNKLFSFLKLEKPLTAESASPIFWIFALLHLVIWIEIPALMQDGLLNFEAYETALMSSQWTLGTSQYPPLAFWTLKICFTLLGVSTASFYFAAQIWNVLGLWAIWKLARHFVSEQTALLIVFASAACQFFNFGVLDYSPLAPVNALTCVWIYLFYLAVKYNKKYYWLMTGIFLAAGLNCHYYYIGTALTFLAALTFCAPLRKYWKMSGPWLALLAAAILSLPSLYFAYQHQFESFRFFLDTFSNESGMTGRLQNTGLFFARQIALILPIGIALLPLTGLWTFKFIRRSDPVNCDPFHISAVEQAAATQALDVFNATEDEKNKKEKSSEKRGKGKKKSAAKENKVGTDNTKTEKPAVQESIESDVSKKSDSEDSTPGEFDRSKFERTEEDRSFDISFLNFVILFPTLLYLAVTLGFGSPVELNNSPALWILYGVWLLTVLQPKISSKRVKGTAILSAFLLLTAAGCFIGFHQYKMRTAPPSDAIHFPARAVGHISVNIWKRTSPIPCPYVAGCPELIGPAFFYMKDHPTPICYSGEQTDLAKPDLKPIAYFASDNDLNLKGGLILWRIPEGGRHEFVPDWLHKRYPRALIGPETLIVPVRAKHREKAPSLRIRYAVVPPSLA